MKRTEHIASLEATPAAEPRRDRNTPLHLNQVELSRRWKLSPRTLERWRCEHRGPAFWKVGGRVLYCLADIEAFELEQRRAAAPTSLIPYPGSPR